MTYYVYCMPDAPSCPDNIATLLEEEPAPGSYVCPICLLPISFKDFEKARQSKAEIETAHLNPLAHYIHTPDNICLSHRACNIAQGDRSVPDFLAWIDGILKRHNDQKEKQKS